MADALTTYHEEKRDRARATAARVTERLDEVRTALAQARADEVQDVSAAATLDAAISASRAAMVAPGLTAGDIEALADTLRTDQIARRKIEAARAGRSARVASLAALDDALAKLVATTTASVGAAEAELASARAAAARQAPFAAPETTDRLAEIVAASQTLLGEIVGSPDAPADPESEEATWRTLIVAARDRVEAIFPEVLREHARARAAQGPDQIAAGLAVQRVAIEDAATARLTSLGGNAIPPQPTLNLARAEAALAAAAVGGPRDWDRALDLLASAAASPPLSAAQASEITALALPVDDPALVSELALVAARTAVTLAEIDLQSAIHDALLADPSADPDAHPDVLAAQAALDASAGTPLSDAEAAHTPAHAASLDAWEIAVPAASWSALANLDTAVALLTGVAASDLAARRTEFDGAEAALVTALRTAETETLARTVAVAGPELARARSAALSDLGAARRLGALRGDA